MLFPKAILQAEFAANARVRAAYGDSESGAAKRRPTKQRRHHKKRAARPCPCRRRPHSSVRQQCRMRV